MQGVDYTKYKLKVGVVHVDTYNILLYSMCLFSLLYYTPFYMPIVASKYLMPTTIAINIEFVHIC